MAYVWWPSTDILCLLFFQKRSLFMPKTKFQSLVFTAIMAFCMVYCMTVYTVSLNMGGLSYLVLFLAIKEMWMEYVVVFLLVFFFITKNAMRLAFRFLDPKASQPILVTLSIQCMTCCQMVPIMTLFATLLHGDLTADWFTQWLQLAVICFPMALCTQVFFIGPLVRFIFRTLFKKQFGNVDFVVRGSDPNVPYSTDAWDDGLWRERPHTLRDYLS